MDSMQYPLPSGAEASAVPFPARTAWPGVELRHLIALQAVVAAGSFNGAAARLGYTQSAVSAQIRALERLIGVRVLDRSRGARSIGLTKEGTVLLRYATEIVARFEAAAAHLDGGRAASTGVLRVGTFRSATLALAAPALGRIPADVAVSLVELADDEALLDLLADGELDLAFAIAPVRKGFATTVLRHEETVAVVSSRDELAVRSEIDLAELASRRMIDEPDATVATALAVSGVGIALIPEFAFVRSDGAVALRVSGDLPQRTIALAWHDDRPRSVAALQFIRAVTSVAHIGRARAA
jgi:molybdate transport repressor ModE-like protein